MKRRLAVLGVDTSHFVGRAARKGVAPANRLRSSDVLIRKPPGKSRTNAARLRRALIESGIPYHCSECSQLPIWNGKDLTLQVDHRDGDCLNNQASNLRFLCPNCHTQTDTFCSNNVKRVFGPKKKYTRASRARLSPPRQRVMGKIAVTCGNCGSDILRAASRIPATGDCYCNQTCAHKATQRAPWPHDEDLRRLVWSVPTTILAQEFGLSSVAIKNRCRRRGIKTPPRGYWMKLRAA